MFRLVLFTKQVNKHFGFLTNTVASGVPVLGALAIEDIICVYSSSQCAHCDSGHIDASYHSVSMY